MVLGESWGEEEEAARRPFVGKSGWLLDQMFADAGIDRSACYITNVVSARPPKNVDRTKPDIEMWWTDNKAGAKRRGLPHRHGDWWFSPEVAEGLASLPAEIAAARPEVIVAFGNLAMWALTGLTGIANWRGSELEYTGTPVPGPWDWSFKRTKGGPEQEIATARARQELYRDGGVVEPVPDIHVIPTYHPAYVLRVWEWKAAVTHDLRARVVGKLGRPDLRLPPAYRFEHNPNYTTAYHRLDDLLARAAGGPVSLVCDVETRRCRLACVGLAWSNLDAICIPFMHVDGRRWWGEADEAALAVGVRRLLTHPNVILCNQNFNYDRQYFVRDPVFGFRAPCHWDTMVAQHLYWPGTPKDLAYLASLYCRWYRFWKEEGKEIEGEADEERWWWYNCLDTVNTFEVWTIQQRLLNQARLA
jgi:uracil-DNA glycosylase